MPPTWQSVLWQVLFPLLDKVRSLSSSASSEKVDTTGNILIHHSRNTAQKQWAETQVLTLSGVSRVFNTKRHLLQTTLGDFIRAWSLLLEFIENAALSKSNEVSLAALKSFQEILYNKPSSDRDDNGSGGAGDIDRHLPIEEIDINCPDNVDIWNVSHAKLSLNFDKINVDKFRSFFDDRLHGKFGSVLVLKAQSHQPPAFRMTKMTWTFSSQAKHI